MRPLTGDAMITTAEKFVGPDATQSPDTLALEVSIGFRHRIQSEEHSARISAG